MICRAQISSDGSLRKGDKMPVRGKEPLGSRGQRCEALGFKKTGSYLCVLTGSETLSRSEPLSRLRLHTWTSGCDPQHAFLFDL